MYYFAIMQIGIYRGYRNGTNGAAANGKYFAMSDNVKALIALADTKATGSVYQNIEELTKNEISMVKMLLAESVPSFPLLYFCFNLPPMSK